MDSWESVDKVVRKDTITKGVNTNYPTEQSKCTIRIGKVETSNKSAEYENKSLNTDIINAESEKDIVIGNACTDIDRLTEKAIKTMSLNESSLITLDLEDQIITFDVTLVKVINTKPIWEWTAEEKYNTSLYYKEQGVELYKTKRCTDAFYMFSRAVKIIISLEPIDADDPKMKDVMDLRLTLYNNMAECHLSKKNYEHVITLCTKTLAKSPCNIKALYRRGIAYGCTGDSEKAVCDLEAATKLDPKNVQAKQNLNLYRSKQAESVKCYESMVKKMFKS